MAGIDARAGLTARIIVAATGLLALAVLAVVLTRDGTATEMNPDPPTETSAAIGDVDGDAHIVVDQFGYLPHATKVAVIRDPREGYDAQEAFTPGSQYAVVDTGSGTEVFADAPVLWGNGVVDAGSGDVAYVFDFSAVTEPGTYVVIDRGNGARSFEFRIADDVYADVLRAAVRTFFFQRAGIAKGEEYTGVGWSDTASHVGPGQDREARRFDATDDPATQRDLSGGWYDAGDYNRYTSWCAGAVITILRAYAESPAAFGDDFGIPESGNSIPDVVDEAMWGLEWLARMQNEDGSVLSILGVDQASPPAAATGPSTYGAASTSATLSTAAAFAFGSAVLDSIGSPSLAAYAEQLTVRAEQAWSWAAANPDVRFYNNDAASGTEGLGAGQQEMDDAGLASVRLAAAVYLFGVTGDEAYRDVVDGGYADTALIRDGYADPFFPQRSEALLHYSTLPDATPEVSQLIKGRYADAMNAHGGPATTAATDPYRAPIPAYTWGSNRTKANFGTLYTNLVTFDVSPEKTGDMPPAADGYLHYLHGVNPLGLVYLSSMGGLGAERSVNEIYHHWFADGSPQWDRVGESTFGPPPGFMPGGPNPQYAVDPCCPGECGLSANATCVTAAQKPPLGQPPAKSYRDFNTGWPANSWALTENSIANQAAYIRLLAKYVAGGTAPTLAD